MKRDNNVIGIDIAKRSRVPSPCGEFAQHEDPVK